MQIKQPSIFQIILSFSVFLLCAFSFTALFNLPIQLVLFIAWFIMLYLGIKLGHPYEALEQSIIQGITKGLVAILILIGVGALVGTWIHSGIVAGLIYYSLNLLSPAFFLPICLVICAITSLATGTSWGTIGTTGLAMLGAGISMGLPAPLVTGAILSGAYFGDKLSPLSDSVVLTASVSRVVLIDHIKGMLPISLTSFILSLILFTMAGWIEINTAQTINAEQITQTIQAISTCFHINWTIFIPIILTLSLLIIRKPAFPVICFGSLLGVIWSILLQNSSPIEAIQSVYHPVFVQIDDAAINTLLNKGGIQSMLPSLIIILFGLGLGGLLNQIGMLSVISTHFMKAIHGVFSATVVTIFTALFANIFGSAMYVSLILTPTILDKSYDKLKIDRRILSRNTEFGGTLTSGMIPWSDNGIFITTVLGLSTFSYLPYMWLNFSCILLAILFSYLGWFNYTSPTTVSSAVN
ncbi:MAG: Na+/H+ antiporter NhaC [Endozoicomonadaceae bacterium]|nr:Na+/H+ antiporter NhaC [Endozoicomonadaceae bacterium]